MKDKYKTLLELFTTDRIAFSLAISRIPTHAFDHLILLGFLNPDTPTEFDIDAVRIILLKHFPSSLGFVNLFAFCNSGEATVSNQAFNLLNDIPGEDLPYKLMLGILERDLCDRSLVALFLNKIPTQVLGYNVLINFMRSDSGDTQECAMFLLNRIPTDKFDFQTLLGYAEDDDFDVCECAAALLMKHFRDRLDLEVLTSITEFAGGEVRGLALEIIAERFACDTQTSNTVEEIVTLFS